MSLITVKCNSCNVVINELLAFLRNVLDVMDEESVHQLCTSSFTAEEIVKAKTLLFESIPSGKKMPVRRKNGKKKVSRDLDDMICLLKGSDPELFPIFVAKELHKLPPVSFDHVDVTKLLKDLLQLQNKKKEQREKADRSDNDDGQDQDNVTFTEIVYLEQDTSDSTDSIPEKPKPKPKPKPSPKTVKIKTVKRRESTLTSDDIPMKRQKNCQSDVDNNELDAFIKYVTCLLKKLPENVFSEVQGEIISCIMRANSRISQSSASLSSQSVSLNKDSGVKNANNLVTVSEITPLNNNALGHNFSIIVAPKETDSGT